MLKVKVFDVDFGKVEVVLNHTDAREWGLRAQDRAEIIKSNKLSAVAIVNTTRTLIKKGQIGVFTNIADKLKLKDGDTIDMHPLPRPHTVEHIKQKLHGETLTKEEIDEIVADITSKRLSVIDLAAFVAALEVRGMNLDEVEHLTRAMTQSGDTLDFGDNVYDKHSLGGVPGDKTTLLVVPIIADAGLIIPKTSSRAITDPAGTADRMEIFAPVEHDLNGIKNIVKKCGGCIVWGGAVDLAPADDELIHVEYPLALDPRPLLLASVMSKKYAVGSDFVVIDIPIGPQAKVKDHDQAKRLASDFIELGKRLGMKVECAVTYGSQPVGNAMGAALEAVEVLEALQGKKLKGSLVEKATAIAGMMLEHAGICKKDEGSDYALNSLRSGRAYKKFKQIVKAQGGNPDITVADIKKMFGKLQYTVKSTKRGYVTRINNHLLVDIAKGAGAPGDRGAGLIVHAKGGTSVKKGDPLFTVYGNDAYKFEYAKKLANETFPVTVEGMLLEEINNPTVISKH